MKKLRNKILMSIAITSVLFACKKNTLPCSTEIPTGHPEHSVNTAALTNEQAILDSLSKYPQLQVMKVIDDTHQVGIHCNVYYGNLPIFSDHYDLYRIKASNEIYSISDFLLSDFQESITPTYPINDALLKAKQELNTKKECFKYQLGLFNINASKGLSERIYKLVWKLQTEDEIKHIILDANTGEVYRSFDGLYH